MDDAFLPAPLLARIAARAPGYDRDNRFFDEDLAELTGTGYLRLAVPVEHGGHGLPLPAVVDEQMRLARHAPATALALVMPLTWTGVAAQLAAAGDASLARVLEEAAAGHVYAYGYSEPGNDVFWDDSLTRAVPDGEGGYAFHGTKIFTSLSPAWTRLGVFGRDDSDPADPRIVHAIIERASPGYRIEETWDVLGMRATQSHTTVLEGVRAAPDRVIRRLPVGPQRDPFIVATLGWFEPMIAAVYCGIAERALELAAEAVHRRTSLEHGGRRLADDPVVRRRIAEMALELDGLRPQIATIAREWADGVDHGERWGPLLVGLKHRVTMGARHVVDAALDVAGGGALFAGNELQRLYRDVRAGTFHPASVDRVHDVVAGAVLGPPGEGQSEA